RRPPGPTLFPYTTLFRSRTERGDGLGVGATHVGAGGGEQAGGGDPALGETDDGYPTLGQRRQVRAPSLPHLHLLRQEAHALLPRSEEHTSELQSLAYLVC